MSALSPTSMNPIPGPNPPPENPLTPAHIAFIMRKGPEHFELLSRQSPAQLSFYMSLTPSQFNFHIMVHKRALASTNHLASNAEHFKSLYTIHFLATGMILQAFPLEYYPETSPDTPAMAVLKQLIREKSQYYVDTYGVDGVVQKLTAGEVLEYGRMPDCSTPSGESCLYITKISIERMGGGEFEHQSLAGRLLWQLMTEKVMAVMEEEKKYYGRAGRGGAEARRLVGPVLYESVGALGTAQAMKWRDVCGLEAGAS